MKTVDLRSDVFTKPTQKMREALSSAEVGNDIFCEDPTVKGMKMIVLKYI